MDLFPDLPGFDIEKSRDTKFATSVQTAASGKELRATFQSGAPRFEYALKLNFARRAKFSVLTPQDEILALLKCYNAARGKLNPLLLIDPVNDVAEMLVFATADGTSTDYQITDDEGWPAGYLQGTPTLYAGGLVPGNAVPWNILGGQNHGYLFGGADLTQQPAPPTAFPVTAGQTYAIVATGVIVYACHVGPGYYTSPADGISESTAHLPAQHISGFDASTGVYGLLGAFADASGNVIKPVWIGSSATLTAPAGATQLLLGVNDHDHTDNSGAFWVTINGAHTPLRAFQGDVGNDNIKSIPIYGIDATTGALTFVTGDVARMLPPAGVPLAWSGTFARKVRFSDDSLSIKQIVAKLFSGDSIKLVSLK